VWARLFFQAGSTVRRDATMLSPRHQKLLVCVVGIFTCYLFYGYVQVSVTRRRGVCRCAAAS
jgi:hypothetical protein